MTTVNEVKQALDAHGQAIDAAINKYETQLKQVQDDIRELAQKRDIATDGGRGARHPLAGIANDPQVMALRNGQTKSALVQIKSSVPQIQIKSLVGDQGSSENDLFDVQPQRAPGIWNDPRRPLSLLDVMRRIPVTGSSFEYTVLDGYTNAAATQALQGTPKAEASLPTEVKVANLATIAHWIETSKQVLQDAPMLQNAIGDLLRFGCLAKLESEIINGTGGTGTISGLTDAGNHTAMVTAPGDTLADVVAKAQAALAVNGWVASAVLVHPNTWREARVERADSGTGLYVAGSWAQPAAPSIWSTPVIVTPSLQEGDVLVLDGSQALLLDRMDVTVEIGRTNSQFTSNLLTILAELRAGLAVLAPSAVQYGILGS